jgi:Tfp pilus assembly PilM family ATPase
MADALKEAVRVGNFSGRQAVLSLPTARQAWLHLRLPKLDPAQIADAVRFEAEGKLPFPTAGAIMRHTVVGETYSDEGPRLEVLVTAVPRAEVERMLGVVERAHLEPAGIVAEPAAVRDGFASLYTRDSDKVETQMVIDIGASATRCMIIRSGKLFFGRIIGSGTNAIDAGIADEHDMTPEDARRLRISADIKPNDRPPTPPPVDEGEGSGFAMLNAVTDRREVPMSPTASADTPGMPAVVDRLAEDLIRCRRYHDATTPSAVVKRVLFIGGGASDSRLCRHLAMQLGIAAQTREVLSRLLPPDPDAGLQERIAACGIEPGVRAPQWTPAVLLAMSDPTAAAERLAA